MWSTFGVQNPNPELELMFCHNCGVHQSEPGPYCAHCGAQQSPEGDTLVQPAEREHSISPARADGRSTQAVSSRPSAGTVVFWLVTGVWVSLESFHAYANWPLLAQLEPGGWWDYLVRAFAPIVLFWLTMGYLRLSTQLRESQALTAEARRLVSQGGRAAALLEDAEAALQKVDAEIRRLRDQEKTRARAAQPRWELNGRISHEKVQEINLRNAGAAATDLTAAWDKALPMAVILSDTALVDRGGHLTVKAMFLEDRLDTFEIKLHYTDGANERRIADIAVSDMEVTIRHDAMNNPDDDEAPAA